MFFGACSACRGQLQDPERAILLTYFTLLLVNEPKPKSVFFYVTTREGIHGFQLQQGWHQELGEMNPSPSSFSRM